MTNARKVRPRTVPRRVSVAFRIALSGEPVARKTDAKPNNTIRDLLMDLCVATGRGYSETALPFEDQRLLNSAALAHYGVRGGAVELGMVAAMPSNPTEQLRKLRFRLCVRGCEYHGITVGIEGRPACFDRSRGTFANLARAEMLAPAFHGHEIVLRSGPSQFHEGETKRTFVNRRGDFIVGEMVRDILAFERMGRPKSRWQGGMDAWHVHLEGIQRNKDGHGYCIIWGS